jgi:hypothetical protein
MLTISIARAKGDGQVERLIPHFTEGGVSNLPYADYTIIFIEHNLQKALNIILRISEKHSSFKTKFP